jgi:maltooligosyltrehalose trehalohydrolase
MIGYEEEKILFVRRWNGDSEIMMAFNFGTERANVMLPVPAGQWSKLLDSSDRQWQGNGSTALERFDSEGKCSLALDSKAFLLYKKDN